MRAPLANARNPRFWLMAGADAVLFGLSLWLAYQLRFDFVPPPAFAEQLPGVLILAVPLKAALFLFFGLYRGMWRYTGLADLKRLVRAVALSEVLLVVVILYRHGFVGFSRSVFVLDGLLALLLTSGLRLGVRTFFARRFGAIAGPGRRALIVGAGRAGEMLLREMAADPGLGLRPVGFLDDDAAKRGRTIHDLPVLGPVSELAAVAARESVDEVIIAVSRATPEEMRAMLETCRATGLPHKILPALDRLLDGSGVAAALREVDYPDLLGREEVRLDEAGIRSMLAGRVVLVTGCGGSIGSELARRIIGFGPARLVLLDQGEYNLYAVRDELEREMGFRDLAAVLGSVTDRELLDRVLAEHRPAVVFHAAAYKHVPMMEENPWQAVRNNVLGTRELMAAAAAAGVERFVLVSTDKAVRPANVMGASKRVTELLMACFAGGPTRFMAVRFGNVLGSSGSVVPLFRRQIERGGPVTVTHPEAARYFMSITEAAQLILQAGAMGRGGEVFVLDMGVPVKIADMARDLIRLSGKEPDRDVRVVFTGLRPGEKLREELITEGEGILRTEHEKILVLGSALSDPEAVARGVERLARAAEIHDAEAIRAAFQALVPEYAAASDDSSAPAASPYRPDDIP
ncbi:polysaccharide biosynthesis protein [Desulfovibrio aminophilus]|uniref:polysaccharide biosynthesis protein n=1 Tax=Desulfovibrio aminophilus TaxID=81425 RepID=UPI00339878AB